MGEEKKREGGGVVLKDEGQGWVERDACGISGVVKSWPSWDFPGGAVVKNPPSNAGDTGSIPGRDTKIPHARGN